MNFVNFVAFWKCGSLRKSDFRALPRLASVDSMKENSDDHKDLKIRIKLPPSPSLEIGAENSRKRKSTTDVSPMGKLQSSFHLIKSRIRIEGD